jgi:hypothetical protein
VIRQALALMILMLMSGCSLSTHPVPPTVPSADAPPVPPTEPPTVPIPPPVAEPPAPKPALPEGAAHQLENGLSLLVEPAVGQMPSVKRAVHLVRDGEIVGTVNLPYLPGDTLTFQRQDLPDHPGAVIIEASRVDGPRHGVRHGAVAIEGGKLVALAYHNLVAPVPEVTEGVFLYLNKYMNQLWVYRDGALIATFPTANGRDPWGTQPTWADLKTNYTTPEGLFSIASKIVNPPYHGLSGAHPPVAGGAPNNPLGTRWMGMAVLPGDGGGIWGFHGTYVPDQIGTWASEGCVRLNTADAEKLFDLVPMGAPVRIVSGR